MDLSGLESADAIDSKDVRRAQIKDCLGSFGMIYSPGCSRIVPIYQLDRFHPRMQSRPRLPQHLIDGQRHFRVVPATIGGASNVAYPKPAFR